jgi:hypothetical protein
MTENDPQASVRPRDRAGALEQVQTGALFVAVLIEIGPGRACAAFAYWRMQGPPRRQPAEDCRTGAGRNRAEVAQSAAAC